MNGMTDIDMEDCELRDQFGNPPIASGRDTNHASGASVVMVDSARLLPLVMLSCFLSGGALFAVIMVAWLLPGTIQANIRADLAKDVAMAQADVGVAKYEASLAKTIAQRLDEKDKLRSKP